MDVSFLEQIPRNGGTWTALVEVTVFDEKQLSHRIKTALEGAHMIYQGELPANCTILLVTNAITTEVGKQWVVTPSKDTVTIPRPSMHASGLTKVVELCLCRHGLFGCGHASRRVRSLFEE